MDNYVEYNNTYCYSCFSELDHIDNYCPICGSLTRLGSKNERILPPGTVLNGKYLIGKAIGEGGFGITYKGMDLNLKMKVAVKEYFPAAFATRDVNSGEREIQIIGGNAALYFQKGLDDFSKEANRLSQFAQLEGVVSVLNFFYENSTAYMVMEYIEGISLKEYLEMHGGKVGWAETIDLLHPIIRSLAAIHSKGIIHRDISPDNIMMTDQGQMILIDFGAARNVEAQRQNTVILKKGYAPLEQYQTSGNQGTWTDVYSICATMYRMISGRKPEDALSVARGEAGIYGLKEYDETLPDHIDTVIRCGMEVLPENRIRTMEELELCLYQGGKVRKNPRKLLRRLIICGAIMLPVSLILLGIGLWNVKRGGAAAETGIKTDEADIREKDEGERETKDPGVEEGQEKKEEDTVSMRYEKYRDTDEDAFTWQEERGGAVITGVDYNLSEIVVPRMIGDMPVREISGMSANAVRVVIKSGAKKIARGAFKNCIYLEEIYIPASVTEIDEKAFENCLALKEIVVARDNPNYYSDGGHLYSVDGVRIF